ncbi:7208_t:CDS:2 [Acaulospora morrowiae]|uniref:7208_t:CDS:1 n=1 Tax=Acaulospora morrowiae TaxID=94023 RepID=A0A9N9APC5_9GLOM|nr:7208_t:CDS:2 [Acaulospora morrowiae]
MNQIWPKLKRLENSPSVIRHRRYGLCPSCNRSNTHENWCQKCNAETFRKNFNNWTSGNLEIDKFIRDSQLRASNNREVLEWIPFNKFRSLKFVARGGYASVYFAVWTDGFIKKWNYQNGQWERRSKWKVALKFMDCSNKITSEFLDEIEACIRCGGGHGLVRCYGISQDPETKNYIIVLYYAHQGNLRSYLDQHYGELNWIKRLGILKQISEGLKRIHQAGFVHRDFHSGNILQGNASEIADLGFSGPASKMRSKSKEVYGVLPYVAPEVLRRRSYTFAADIYSFGMIMWDVLTCQPPFGDRAHDVHLALDICLGRRPTVEEETPKPFAKLMKCCWDANPSKRPTAQQLYETLHQWYWDLHDGKVTPVSAAFMAADSTMPQPGTPASSRPVTQTHPLAIYTSRLLDFPDLPEPVNALSSFHCSHHSHTTNSSKSSNDEKDDKESSDYVTRQYDDELVLEPEVVSSKIEVTLVSSEEGTIVIVKFLLYNEHEEQFIKLLIFAVTFQPEDDEITRKLEILAIN